MDVSARFNEEPHTKERMDMIKFDTITVGVIVGALCFLVVSLLALVGWLSRAYQRLIKERLDQTTLTATKAEIKTSTNEANIKATRDMIDQALDVAELRGEVKAFRGMLIGISDELVKQSKDYALGCVRRDMHMAISQEIQAQFKELTKKGWPSTMVSDPTQWTGESDGKDQR